MPSPRTWLRNWINIALFVEEGWPHDALNRGIFLGLGYLGFPVVVVVAFTFLLTGWSDSAPVWLSASIPIYAFIAAWIALDEWRSRRRSSDGHGWIWQVVVSYGPRRRLNQSVVTIILIAHFAGAFLAYIDRFSARDIESLDTVRLIEAVLVVSVDLWLVGLTIAVFRWAHGLSYWGVLKLTTVAMLLVNALVSVGDGPWPWMVFVVILLIALGIPGWLVHAVWRRRYGSGTSEEFDDGSEPAGLPGWW
jgi:hypothetical protein